MDNPPLTRLARVVVDEMSQVGLSENAVSKSTAIPRSTLKRRLLTGDFTHGELWAVARLLDTTPADLMARAEQVPA
jgi:hypothetical protein